MENKRHRPSGGAQAKKTHDDSKIGFGLCGLGDMRHAIGTKMFGECSKSKGFCTNMAKQWAQNHGESVAGDAIEPKESHTQRKQCDDFCCATGLVGKNPLLYQSADRLLRDVTRSLKSMYKKMKKELSIDARHPTLFARWVSQDQRSERVAAWLISFASFKPLRLDAIQLLFPKPPLIHPFVAKLQTLPVYKGDDLKMFAFSLSKRMAADIASLNPTQDPQMGSLQYAFNVGYRLNWREGLTEIEICDELSWTSLGVGNQAGNESDNDSDDDDDRDSDHETGQQEERDELDELSSLVGGLTGGKQSAVPVVKKRPGPRQKAARGKEPSTAEPSGQHTRKYQN